MYSQVLRSVLLTCVLLFNLVLGSEQFNIDLEDTEPKNEQESYNKLSQDSLLWGPYNSGRYVGIKPRLEHGLLSGLMWFNVDEQLLIMKLRDFYEQGDNMGKANWVNFDPRYGGSQFISDNDCHINITIDFVKSDNGRNWGVKVKSVPHKGYESIKTSFIWYSGLQGEKVDPMESAAVNTGFLRLENSYDSTGYTEPLKLTGFSEELGIFDIKFRNSKSSKHPKAPKLRLKETDPRRTHHMSLRAPNKEIWQSRGIFLTLLKDSVSDIVENYKEYQADFPAYVSYCLRNMHNYEGNLHYIQNMYEGAAEFDVVFNEKLSPPTEHISFSNIEQRIKTVCLKVDENFKSSFHLKNFDEDHKEFGKEILSGLLGGLSYFHGDHLVDRVTIGDDDDFPVDENSDGTQLPKLTGSLEGPFELFTLVPSRPFFPRGFYWDEGFHLLPLLEYDSDLVLEIVQSWFNLIDSDGWIAREQILGPESRSRVPEPFQTQSPAILNPPTLVLAFSYLLEKSHAAQSANPVNLDSGVFKDNVGLIVLNNHNLLVNYTREIYPKLKLHLERFRTTQKGITDEPELDRNNDFEGFRWRGRTTTHCLASGMDDYPRPLPLDPAELHVDLLCWIGVMTRSTKMIANLLDVKEDVKYYEDLEARIIASIEKVHWSEKHKAYCDVTVDDDDETVHVCHKGYLSIFPFLTKMIPEDQVDKIESIVDLLSDPNELWSDFGIRSLSKSDSNYRTAENYWRSPVWVHMNYLVLDNLQHYYGAIKSSAPQSLLEKMNQTYSELRKNLIKNVYQEWQATGYVWEQYDDITGEHKGAKNFLGWTSTILLIMEMDEKLF